MLGKNIAAKLKGVLIAAVLSTVATTSAMAAEHALRGNVRIVIGSTSTGGDTYQISNIVANQLEKKLDLNVKVDAVGASSAFRILSRDSRGHTLMIFHDQSYLGDLYGVPGYSNIFDDYRIGPTLAINPGNAYLVARNSPYKSMDDVMNAAAEGKRVRVAIQPGGVSEIGFSAMKNALKLQHPGKEENLVAINTGSQSDKNQQLFNDQADVINGSVQANGQFTHLPADDQKAMRFIWLTANHDTIKQAPESGYGKTGREELLKYVEPNVTVAMGKDANFTFDKEFFFLYNKDMDPEIVNEIDQALSEIYQNGDIQKAEKKAFFIPDFRKSDESEKHLKQKMAEYRKVINNIQ
ncbi:ABC transporter substrate-binding protein [Kushneria phosphatilytica]|uniref:ABC transporter substrate-binding protein n=2 Tax=Kushneria phosphatilytica TaxID=657387 RepID=A0A5C1A502_9GAMM|nr:ABC transporter substrate-binding protein [Kushneria phosphatilytica]